MDADVRDEKMTTDGVRQNVFNVLEQAPWFSGFAGARVLDLFAGAGAMGFEALTRGAAFALFVETDATARGAIRNTIEARGLFGVTRIHRRDARDLGAKPAGLADPFGLVFVEPPMDSGLGAQAMARLGDGGWIMRDAIIVLIGETAPGAGFETLGAQPGVSFLRPRP